METHLTQREMTIISEFVKGSTNPEIAQSLFVSVATVKFYMSEIMRKTNCENRIQLLIYLLSNPDGIALAQKAKECKNSFK